MAVRLLHRDASDSGAQRSREITPYIRLWASVVNQAVDDACRINIRNEMKRVSYSITTEAIDFLFTSRSDDILEILDITPDLFRRAILRFMFFDVDRKDFFSMENRITHKQRRNFQNNYLMWKKTFGKFEKPDLGYW